MNDDSPAAIRRRADDARWPLILDMLRAGATLYRPARMRDYYTDDGQHMGRYLLSAGRVKKLEAAGVLARVGADRYGAGALPEPPPPCPPPRTQATTAPQIAPQAAPAAPAEDMTPEGFKAWRGRMAARSGGTYSQAAAARDLGKTADMIKRYERGPERKGSAIPRDTALACAALEAGLEAE